MSFVRGVKCSAGAAAAAAAACAGVSLLTDASLVMAPIAVGAVAGLAMAVNNRGKDGAKAGTSAALVAGGIIVMSQMAMSYMNGMDGALNPIAAVLNMQPLGIMSLVIGLCAAWWLGGRETFMSLSLAGNSMVKRMSKTLEGPLGAVSREVDEAKASKRKAA